MLNALECINMTESRSGTPRCENCGQFKKDVKEFVISTEGGIEGVGDFNILPPDEVSEMRCTDCRDGHKDEDDPESEVYLPESMGDNL